jgi:hypothetical protein
MRARRSTRPASRRSRDRYQAFLHADSGETFIEWLKRKHKQTQR